MRPVRRKGIARDPLKAILDFQKVVEGMRADVRPTPKRTVQLRRLSKAALRKKP